MTSDRVARWFGDVLAATRGGPPDGARRRLVDLPPGILLDPVIMPALGAAVTHTSSTTRLIGHVMLEITVHGGPPAARAGASPAPDLGRAPNLHPAGAALTLDTVGAHPRG